jgi:hypothetical protein
LPSRLSGGRDLAAWISAPIGSCLRLLPLRWLEGKRRQRTDTPSNKSEAVYLLLQSGSGERRLILAGLGGEGESVCTPASIAVEGLLAGRGGEEEPSHVVTSASACWRSYPCCLWCRGSTPKLLLSAGHGGEGEDSDGAAASIHWWWCIYYSRAADPSPTPPLRRRSSWEASQRGTYAGVAAPPLHLLADWRPFSRRFYFPETKKSEGKLNRSCHDAGPSGSSPAPVSSLWHPDAVQSFEDLIAFSKSFPGSSL